MTPTIHFDGACEPRNPGGWATAGWIVTLTDGSKIRGSCLVSPPGPTSTNNLAEYHALLRGIETALAAGVRGPIILGDSRLVVEQVSGRWAVRADHLKPLVAQARAALTEVCGALRWIPREQNAEADALSMAAYRAARRGGPKSFRYPPHPPTPRLRATSVQRGHPGGRC